MPKKLFTSTYQPLKRGRHKGSTPTDCLRNLAHTKIAFQNPITGLPDKAEVNYVVALQLILKATQDSDLPSIREYFDRIDGKVKEVLETTQIDKRIMEEEIEFVPLADSELKNRVAKYINDPSKKV